MPQDDPQIGEAWELVTGAVRGMDTVTSSEPGPRAIIQGFQGEAIRLESDRGRIINIPRRTFHLSWRFVAAPPSSRECSYPHCSLPARFLQNQQVVPMGNSMDTDNIVWVCFEHVRVHEGQAGRICPSCEHQTSGQETEHVTQSGFVVAQECENCRRPWCVLIGRGDDTDGFEFTSWIQQAADFLEGGGRYIVRVRIGRTALATLLRSVGNLGTTPNDPRFLGTHLIPDDSVGSNNLVAIGYHATEIRGVSSLTASTPPPKATPLPATGSEWRAVDAPYDTVTVFGIMNRGGGEPEVRFGGENDISRLPLREFYQRYRMPLTEETPGVVRPNDSTNPKQDETWWAVNFTGPVYIIGVYETNGIEYVKYRGKEGQKVVTKTDFLKACEANPPTVHCEIGEEWVNPQNNEVYTVVSMDDRSVLLSRAGEESREHLWTFAHWKKIVRKNAFERIMEDDEDDDV